VDGLLDKGIAARRERKIFGDQSDRAWKLRGVPALKRHQPDVHRSSGTVTAPSAIISRGGSRFCPEPRRSSIAEAVQSGERMIDNPVEFDKRPLR